MEGGALTPASDAGVHGLAAVVRADAVPPSVTFPEGSGSISVSETGLPNGTNWSVSAVANTTGILGWDRIGNGTHAGVFDPSNGNLYLPIITGATVVVVNASSGGTVATVAVGQSPRIAALDPVNGLVYVTNRNSSNVSILDPANNSVVGSISVGIGPVGIAYDAANGLIYVANEGSLVGPVNGTVSVIAPSNATVIGSIPAGVEPRYLMVDPLNGWIYVANYGGDNLTVINGSSDDDIGSFALGENLSTPALDSANGDLFVVDNNLGDEILEVNATTGAFLQSASTAEYPTAPYFDPLNGLVYVSGEFSDDVSVYNASDLEPVGSIPTGDFPAGLVPEGSTGYLFLLQGSASTIEVINGSLPNGGAGALLTVALSNVTANGSGVAYHLLPDGNYALEITPLPGWVGFASEVASEPFVVANASAFQTVAYLPSAPVAVTFAERGLPPAATWTVSAPRGVESNATSGTSLTVLERRGFLPLSIVPPGGYGVALISGPGDPDQSSALVPGPVTWDVTFSPLAHLFFNESTTGRQLYTGASWAVDLRSTRSSGGPADQSVGGTGASIEVTVPAGVPYRFTLSYPAGYRASPLSGRVLVPIRLTSWTQPLRFILVTAPVHWEEMGVPSRATWTVAIASGPPVLSYPLTQSKTAPAEIVFRLPVGVYTFTATSGSATVSGSFDSFAPSPSFYVVVL